MLCSGILSAMPSPKVAPALVAPALFAMSHLPILLPHEHGSVDGATNKYCKQHLKSSWVLVVGGE